MLKRIFPVFTVILTALTLLVLVGCGKKSEPAKDDAVLDTAVVLPEPPELEPLDEELPPDTAPALAETPQKTVKSTSTRPASPDAGLTQNGPYTLQAGIYNNEKLAQRTADKLKADGIPAYVARVTDPTPALQGTYYRVRVGAFATTRAARAYAEANLKPLGIDAWVDLKGRDSEPVNPVVKPAAKPASPPKAPAPTPEPAAVPAPTPAAPAVEPPAPEPAAQDTKPAPKLPDW